jgi:dipeptidyl aminopeptidase/acylaminoacyl peptidase
MNSNQPVRRFFFLVIVAAISALAVCGQQTSERQLSPLPVEEILGQRNFLDQTPISLSRDGRMVAYTLRDAQRVQSQDVGLSRTYTSSGVLIGLLGSDVWINDTATGQSQNLTKGAGASWGPAWSPDGERLAFYSDRSGEQRVWLWERKSGTMKQLADAPARSLLSDPIQWTADGTQVLVRLLPEGMNIKQANDLYVEPLQEPAEKTPDTTVRVYRSFVPTSKEDKQRQSAARLQIFNKRALADLALIDITNGQVTRLTRGYHPIWFSLSPDRRTLAFTEMKGLESDRETQSVFDIVAVDLGPNSNTRVLATNVRQQSGRTVSWSPDSKMLAYITGGPLAKGDCFIVPIAGGDPRNITPSAHPNFDNEFSGPIWDSAGTYIYLPVNKSLPEADTLWRVIIAETRAAPFSQIKGRKIVNVITTSAGGHIWSPDGGRSLVVMTRDDATKQEGLYKIDVNAGSAEKLREGAVSFGRLPSFKVDVSAHGRVAVYSLQSAGQPEDLWITESRDLSSARRVTHSNPQLDRYLMGESRVIEWLSSDGQLLRGSLLLPAGYKAGTRYPLVVVQYPGSMFSNLANNYPQNSTLNTQLLATRGYAVLLPDLPKKRGTIMSDIPKAVLPGINKVVELGIADSERIGVFGHSFGGYGVLSLIVQTTRFKAAVDSAGVSNAITWYGQMSANGGSIYVGQTEEFITAASLWQNKASFIENSPVFFLDRVQTPLLILQGTSDEATDPTHSDQVFVFLRSLGKEVEYVKYTNAVHAVNIRSYPHQIDFLNRTIAWFDRWLKAPAPASRPADKPSAHLERP